MRPTRVVVIGGGPAGLLSARLIALAQRHWQVTVYETLQTDATFGFGVGFTTSLLHSLRQADPQLSAALEASMLRFAGAEFRLPAGVVPLTHAHAGAIGRARLLSLLVTHARAAGVEVRVGSSVRLDDVRHAADLVIASDGASSGVRSRLAQRLGASVTPGRGWYIWCGSNTEMDRTIFSAVQASGGTFVAHSYPHARDRSTHVIEADADSIAALGGPPVSSAQSRDSDAAALGLLSAMFSDLLGGQVFVGNRSRWMHFLAVRCKSWVVDNVVLLGDAAATAHPSIGSGTKLALESAIELASCLRAGEHNDLPELAREFEQRRRPAVERLQELAQRSQLWWESFPSRITLSPARIALAYLSRAGAVSLSELTLIAPALVARAAADFAKVDAREVPQDDIMNWVLRRPLQTTGSRFSSRLQHCVDDSPALVVSSGDAWGPESEKLTHTARALLEGGAPILRLTGDRSRSALLDRLAVGERLRQELGAVISVTTDAANLSDAADGLLAGRTDLVAISH